MEGAGRPAPAGWYSDPDDAALQRFWDGTRWTNSRMPQGEAIPLETDDPPPDEPRAPRYPSDALSRPSEPVQPTATSPPAAWYQDPENPGGMRYWDGAAWTEHQTDYLADPPKPPPSEGMVAAGYILAFLFPIIGVVIGVMLISRDSRHGRWVLGLSVLFFLGFLVVGQLIEPDNG